jgi:hypothetical protein
VTGDWYSCVNTGVGTFTYKGGNWGPGLTIYTAVRSGVQK